MHQKSTLPHLSRLFKNIPPPAGARGLPHHPTSQRHGHNPKRPPVTRSTLVQRCGISFLVYRRSGLAINPIQRRGVEGSDGKLQAQWTRLHRTTLALNRRLHALPPASGDLELAIHHSFFSLATRLSRLMHHTDLLRHARPTRVVRCWPSGLSESPTFSQPANFMSPHGSLQPPRTALRTNI